MFIYVDGRKSSIEEVRNLLGLEAKDIPQSSNKVFERLIRKVIDPSTGRQIVPRALAIPTQFTATDRTGNAVHIRYVENARPRPRSLAGDIVYTPLTIALQGKTLPIKDGENAKFFFLYVNPWNRNSPLNRGKRKAEIKASYEFVDRADRAKQDLVSDDILFRAMTTFRSYAERELRQIAKGYGFGGVDSMSIYEVQHVVREKMKENPAQFIEEMEAMEVAFKGVITDAIDKGILKNTDSAGYKDWTLNGKNIYRSKPGEDAVLGISQVMTGDMDLYDEMDQELEAFESKTAFNKPENKIKLDRFAPKMNDQSYQTLKPSDKKIAKEGVREGKTDENGLFWPESKLTDEYQARLEKWAHMDVDDPELNTQTKKAMQNPNNIPFIEAKRKELGLVEV